MTDTDTHHVVALIKEKLEARFSPSQLEIVDKSHEHRGHIGSQQGKHFAVTIVSTQFIGLTLLQRHRRVYDAVDDLMNHVIHALSIQARTPDESPP